MEKQADGPQRAWQRVAVIGPVTPYRSGIANHTTHLAPALAQAASAVLVLSFSRQYPRLLFPGESDRDPDARPLRDPTAEFSIDSLNPLTWRRAARRIADFRAELVIIPWWTFFLAPCLWFIARACRRRGMHVRFFCHNVVDHEASFWKRWLAFGALRQGHSYAVHNEVLASALRTAMPAATVIVHPHPIYDHFPPPRHSLPRRADLELLFFGLVRPYKGLDVMIRALARLPMRSVRVSVVGEFWQGRGEAEAEIQERGLADTVELVSRYVSDAEAADYFSRCDAVVLPYHSVTGSGVIPLAYHYNKPVVVTDLPGLTDVVRDRETGFVFPVNDDAALAALIDGVLSTERCAAMAPAIAAYKAALTWDSLARAVLARR